MCDEISEKYGILVAPTVNYGVNLPLDKRTMTGTTGITYETLKETLKSITEYWKKQGFKHFFCSFLSWKYFSYKSIK